MKKDTKLNNTVRAVEPSKAVKQPREEKDEVGDEVVNNMNLTGPASCDDSISMSLVDQKRNQGEDTKPKTADNKVLGHLSTISAEEECDWKIPEEIEVGTTTYKRCLNLDNRWSEDPLVGLSMTEELAEIAMEDLKIVYNKYVRQLPDYFVHFPYSPRLVQKLMKDAESLSPMLRLDTRMYLVMSALKGAVDQTNPAVSKEAVMGFKRTTVKALNGIVIDPIPLKFQSPRLVLDSTYKTYLRDLKTFQIGRDKMLVAQLRGDSGQDELRIPEHVMDSFAVVTQASRDDLEYTPQGVFIKSLQIPYSVFDDIKNILRAPPRHMNTPAIRYFFKDVLSNPASTSMQKVVTFNLFLDNLELDKVTGSAVYKRVFMCHVMETMLRELKSIQLQGAVGEALTAVAKQAEVVDLAVARQVADLLDKVLHLAGTTDLCKSCLLEVIMGFVRNQKFVEVRRMCYAHHHYLSRTPQLTDEMIIFFSMLFSFLRIEESNPAMHLGGYLSFFLGSGTIGLVYAKAFANRIQVQGSDNSLYTLLEVLSLANPFKVVSAVELQKLGLRCRSYVAALGFAAAAYKLVSGLVATVTSTLSLCAVADRSGLNTWMAQVEELEEVKMSATGGVDVLATDIKKYTNVRRNLLRLLGEGVNYEKSLKTMLSDTQGIGDRVSKLMAKLRKILTKHSAAFVGCDKKVKPLTIYLHGERGVGKTVVTDHILSDVFQLLGFDKYDSFKDKYSVNPLTPYFDTYAYQPVCEFQDIFQLRDKTIRMNEAINIIKAADESSYALNIASCDSKGAVFFASDFLLMTSNLDVSTHETELASLLESPEAFLRRIDMNVKVTRTAEPEGLGFNKDIMRFTLDGNVYTYNEFIARLCERYVDVKLQSNSLTKFEESPSRIDDIKSLIATREQYSCIKVQGEESLEDVARNVVAMAASTTSSGWVLRVRTYLDSLDISYSFGPFLKEIPESPDMLVITDGSGNEDLPITEWDNNGLVWSIIYEGSPNTMLDSVNVLIRALKSFKAVATEYVTSATEKTWTFILRPLLKMMKTDFKNWLLEVLRTSVVIVSSIISLVYVGRFISMFTSGASEAQGFEGSSDVLRSGNKAFKPSSFRSPRALVPQGCQAEINEICEMIHNKDTSPLPPCSPCQGHIEDHVSNIMLHDLRPNIGLVKSHITSMNALAIGEKIVIVMEHLIGDNDTPLQFVFPGGVSFSFLLNEARSLYIKAGHMYVIDFSTVERYKCMRPFRSIVKFFDNNVENKDMVDGLVFTAVSLGGAQSHVFKYAQDLKYDTKPLNLEFKSKKFVATDYMSYRAPTRMGDCGAPLIVLSNGTAKIKGLHFALDVVSGVAYGSVVTEEWLREVQQALGKIEVQGKLQFPITHEISAMSFEADDLPSKAFIPRKSKLAKSPFWTEEGLFAPAPLKGEIDGISPAQRALGKSDRPLVAIDPEEVWQDAEELIDDYEDCEFRDVLTTNQAVFGIPEVIPPIKMSGGVGFPLCKKYTRAELLDGDKKTINKVLTDAIDKVEIDIKNRQLTFVVLDYLKDERVLKEKAKEGKTRLFCVLPIEVNIVLKKLFGAFVQHVTNMHNTKIVKVGMSLKGEDVRALATYFELDADDLYYLDGDFSASDRCIPYEVFLVLVQRINKWYKDDKAEERLHLARHVFAPVHHFDGLEYVTYQGMPSGSYLTSVFNSLAYAVIFKHCCRMIGVPIHRLGTFGDDSILVVKQKFDVARLVEKLSSMGMTYTGLGKDNAPEWSSKEQVTFLQRTFVKRGGWWFMPMQKDRIRSIVMWYRVTAETKTWSEETIRRVLGEIWAMEAFQHGRQYFEQVVQELNLDLDYTTLFCSYTERGPLPDFGDFLENPTYGLFPATPMLTNATCQGDVAPEDQTTISGENITGIVDIVDTKEVEPTTAELVGTDLHYRWGEDFERSLERFVALPEVVLTSSSPIYPVIRYTPLVQIFADPYIRQRLQNCTYLRFDVEVELRMVSTKFHYGQVLVVPRPGLFINQAAVTLNPNNLYIQDYPYAWDSVYTASQCPHKVMLVTSGSSVKVRIPWTYPLNYISHIVDRQIFKETRGYTPELLAVLDLYQITPIQPVDLDRPVIAAWARLTNVKAVGYTSAKARPDPGPYTYQPPKWPSTSTDTSFVVLQGKKPGKSARFIDQQKELGTFGEIGNVIDTVADVLSPFISPVLAFFGLSRPRETKGSDQFIEMPYNFSSSVGKSPALALTFSQEDQSKVVYDDMTDIKTLAEIPNYMRSFSLLKSTDMVKMSYSLRSYSLVAPYEVNTVAGYVASPFTYARSNVKYHIRFSSSQFINARVLIRATSQDDSQRDFLVITRIVDVCGDILEEFELPYFHELPIRVDGSQWYVTLSLLSDIVSTEATETRPIIGAIWVSFPEMEVAQMGPFRDSTGIRQRAPIFAPTAYKETSGFQRLQVQGDELETGVKYLPLNETIPDIPTSIYHIMKRQCGLIYANPDTSPVWVDPMVPLLPIAAPVGTNAYDVPLWYWYSLLFKYYSGGLELYATDTLNDLAISTACFHSPRVFAPTPAGPDAIRVGYKYGGVGINKSANGVFYVPYRHQQIYAPLSHNISPGAFVDNPKASYGLSYPILLNKKYLFGWAADDYSVRMFTGCPTTLRETVNIYKLL